MKNMLQIKNNNSLNTVNYERFLSKKVKKRRLKYAVGSQYNITLFNHNTRLYLILPFLTFCPYYNSNSHLNHSSYFIFHFLKMVFITEGVNYLIFNFMEC